MRKIEMYRATHDKELSTDSMGYKFFDISGRESIGSGFLLDFVTMKEDEGDDDVVMAIVSDSEGNVEVMSLDLIRIEL